jgi:hypothetical protein
MSQATTQLFRAEVGDRHFAGQPFHFHTPSQEARIRRIFGLAADNPLPSVQADTLATYYSFLASRLSLPFKAICCHDDGKPNLIHYVCIGALVSPRGRSLANGLLCQVLDRDKTRISPLIDFAAFEDHPNRQLLDDYAFWFVNGQ